MIKCLKCGSTSLMRLCEKAISADENETLYVCKECNALVRVRRGKVIG